MFTEDLTDFLDPDDFAVQAVYLGQNVNGILDREFVMVLDMEAEHPTFTCRAADVSNAAHGDAITVNSTAYTVVGLQPDGTGITKLILQES